MFIDIGNNIFLNSRHIVTITNRKVEGEGFTQIIMEDGVKHSTNVASAETFIEEINRGE